MRRPALLALSVVGVASVLGCSSGAEEIPLEVDATTDARVDGSGGDADAKIDTGRTSGTTGKTCRTNEECDLVGDGVNQCTADWFANGAIFPDPVCFGSACSAGDPSGLSACDDGRGWCLEYGTFNRCYPTCSFSISDSSPPTGCVGRDVCNWLGWAKDSMGIVRGTGYCFGGCVADADCPTGQKCQKEYGYCYFASRIWTPTLKVGDPCTKADWGDSSTPPHCNCYISSAASKGYCTTFCKMGDPSTPCPTGFTCDAQLPMKGDTVVYSAAAKGLAGACLKNCTADAECAPLGGYCEQMAGTGRKTCQFGVRPTPTGDAGGGG